MKVTKSLKPRTTFVKRERCNGQLLSWPVIDHVMNIEQLLLAVPLESSLTRG